MSQYQPHRFSDCLAQLPAPARRKFNALVSMLADIAALTRSTLEREKLLESSLYDIEQQLAQCDPRVDTVRIAAFKDELRSAGAELTQLNAERSKRNGIRANCDQVIARLRDNFITTLNQPVRAVTVTAVPGKGEDLKDAILRVRSALNAAQAQLQQVQAAPLPAAEIKAALVAHVDRLARDGAPRLDLAGGKVAVHWPDETQFANPGSALAAPSGSASQLLAWLFHDEMVKALTAGADDAITDGITAAARGQRTADLGARIRQLEHEEEALVVQALAAGLEVHRRPAASGWALLGLEPVASEPLESEPAALVAA